MTLLRLFIPGDFEDAQIYMGRLIAFTTDRRTQTVELERLTGRLETHHPEWGGLLTLAFARNDWLTGGVMRALSRSSAVATALNATFSKAAETDLEASIDGPEDALIGLDLDERDVAFTDLTDFDQAASLILDAQFYAGRMYLATTSGLFDYDIDWQAIRVKSSRRRIDARCVAASAEYGAVNASCEDDGLFTGFDEFGWSGRTETSLTQTALRSTRTAWLGFDLVNYDGPTHPQLLLAQTEQVEPDGGNNFTRQKKIVTRLASGREMSVLGNPFIGSGPDATDVQFVWNSSGRFFINTHSGGFFSAKKNSAGYEYKSFAENLGRVIAVEPFQQGWVIETDFSVHLFTNGELIHLVDAEALSVRTFAGSKRYRRLVAVTTEDGIYLLSSIPEFG